MNISRNKLETSLETAQNALKNLDLPVFMKKRWSRALEKAKERLIEQPYFSWQPDRLLIVSVPQEQTEKSGCRFYEANEEKCRRVDKSGFCQAFFEGFPCWHRAAFLLLKICVGEDGENESDKICNHAVSENSVNQN